MKRQSICGKEARAPAFLYAGALLGLIVFLFVGRSGLEAAPAEKKPKKLLYIEAGCVWTGTGDQFRPGGILLENGRIIHVGKPLSVSKDVERIVVSGGFAMPAFLDAHSYLGVRKEEDRNESLRSIYPDFHVADALEGVVLSGRALYEEGYAALYVSPGDRSVVGGWGAVVDLIRRRVDEGVPALSVTQAALKDDRPPTSPLGVAELLERKAREALKGAKLLRIFASTPGETELALNFAASQGAAPVLVGCLCPDLLPQFSAPKETIVVPPFTVEVAKLKRIAQAARSGVSFAFGSFAEDQWHINNRFMASLAVAYGMPREAALRALTINAARASGLPSCALKVGVRPVIAVFRGDVLNLSSPLACLVAGGRVLYRTEGGPKR